MAGCCFSLILPLLLHKVNFLKRLGFILILFSLFMQGGGYSALLSLKRTIWAYSVHQLNDFKKENAVTFIFHENYFEEIKINKKEFILDNAMYDIIQVENNGDSLKVVAHIDNFEFEILKNIKKLLQEDDVNNTDEQLVKIDKIDYLVPDFHLLILKSKPAYFQSKITKNTSFLIDDFSSSFFHPPCILV